MILGIFPSSFLEGIPLSLFIPLLCPPSQGKGKVEAKSAQKRRGIKSKAISTAGEGIEKEHPPPPKKEKIKNEVISTMEEEGHIFQAGVVIRTLTTS